MAVTEIRAKTLLRKMRRIDSFFVASAGMNLYRGCAHDCAYCDGRAEKYRVAGVFGHDVQAKVNAVEVLKRELGLDGPVQAELFPQRRHGGFLLLGGGVGDSYQPAEKGLRITRQVLELLAAHGIPVHILTKSSLVLRDADLLEQLARSAGALVSFSISTADDRMGALLEPGASPPSERLRALSEMRRRGINGGIFLMPVIPFLSDSAEQIDQSVAAAGGAEAQYVVFGGMTMKQGRQKEHFLNIAGQVDAGLAARYERLYPPVEGDRPDWGNAPRAYYRQVTGAFARAAHARGMPVRIPLSLCRHVLSERELAVVRAESEKAAAEMDAYRM
jgi:DNA repair photolyase